MRLYVANCTRQRHVIYYRLDFDRDGNFSQSERQRSLKQISVDSGRQVTVGGDLHQSQAQSIMDQLAKHGAIGIEEIKGGRLPKQMIPFVMSVIGEVPAKLMKDIHSHNTEILFSQGKRRRAAAALTANKAVEQISQANVKEFEVEMEQLPPSDGEDEPEGPALAEGYRKPAEDEVLQEPPRRGPKSRR